MQNYSLDLSRAPSASRATLLVNKTRKMGLDGLLNTGLWLRRGRGDGGRDRGQLVTTSQSHAVTRLLEQAGILFAVRRSDLENQLHHSNLAQGNGIHHFREADGNRSNENAELDFK